MATTESMNKVQEAYIAFYGRPADAAGQEYWADKLDNGSWADIVDAFGNSDEAASLYGAGGDQAQVEAIYLQCWVAQATTLVLLITQVF
jgi:hypothetical protein